MITDAHADVYHKNGWDDGLGWFAIPEAIELGRACVRHEVERAGRMRRHKPCPVRVVDSSGAVVQQWGTP